MKNMQINTKTNDKHTPVKFHSTMKDTLYYLLSFKATTTQPLPYPKCNSQFPKKVAKNTVQGITKKQSQVEIYKFRLLIQEGE